MAEGGGVMSIVILLAIVLAALFIFFEVFGFVPNSGPTAAAAAK
jgi:hypothetical protein